MPASRRLNFIRPYGGLRASRPTQKLKFLINFHLYFCRFGGLLFQSEHKSEKNSNINEKN